MCVFKLEELRRKRRRMQDVEDADADSDAETTSPVSLFFGSHGSPEEHRLPDDDYGLS